ncbi:hypothetical protein DBR06_SOUSAS8310047, partial [Sousa chinensis]
TIPEGFPTVIVLTGFLSSMNFLVPDKVGAQPKSFPTLITLVRFLSSM